MAFNDTYRESIQTKHIANVGFTSTAKGVSNEGNAIANPHQVLASQIPAVDVVGTYGPLVASGISAGLVEKHTVQLTADLTVNGNKAWFATEDNCTTSGHAARGVVKVSQWMRYAETQYKLRLFEDTGSNEPNYSAEILPSEVNFNWEYDASAGIVYFDEDPSVNGKTLPLWAEIYTYVGDTVEDGLGSVSDDFYTKIELDGGQLDNRYYTESEIDSMLSGQDTFLELEDVEIPSYTDGRVLFTTASGVTEDSAFSFDSSTGTISTTAVTLGTGTSVDEIVTTVTSGTTDNQIPTAKAVWDLTEAAASAVHTHYDYDAVYVSNTEWTYGSGFSELPNGLIISVNGVKQRQGAGYDCIITEVGGVITITFSYSVYISDWVNIEYYI